ncbi:MAG: hypothetical protein AAFZ65_06080 [Planctomycetota bacterium]
MLGSASGTSPGAPLEVGTLPLVLDAYSSFTIVRANQPPFGSTLGNLDLQGAGLASISLPAGSSPALIGTALNHAYVRFDPLTAAITGVSPPEFLFLLP